MGLPMMVFRLLENTLDKGNILPLGNPWYWDPQQLATSQAPRKQRLLDSMVFLYELQNEFYHRYVQAMREAGYEGEIVASNWQAGSALQSLSEPVFATRWSVPSTGTIISVAGAKPYR